jgi:glutaredoxin-like protein
VTTENIPTKESEMNALPTLRVIPEAQAEAVRAHLEQRLVAPVALDLFIEPKSVILVPSASECELCEETRALMEDVASLSDRLTLSLHDIRRDAEAARQMGVHHVPTLVLRGAAKGVVRYVGIPAGLEFATLLEVLEAVARGRTPLTEDTRAKLASLAAPVHIQVFVTPTCPYCPRVAVLAQRLAVESERVTADVIEISEFPQLAREYRVQGVPKTVINGVVELLGAQSEAQFVDAVASAAAVAEHAR